MTLVNTHTLRRSGDNVEKEGEIMERRERQSGKIMERRRES